MSHRKPCNPPLAYETHGRCWVHSFWDADYASLELHVLKNLVSKINVFIDLDGVLADFDKSYKDLTGKIPTDDIDWNIVEKNDGFFANLSLINKELVSEIKSIGITPKILSGVMTIPGPFEERRRHARERVQAMTLAERAADNYLIPAQESLLPNSINCVIT